MAGLLNIFRNKTISAVPEANAEGFWENTKKQFRKNKLAIYSFRFILVMFFVALLADFLANEKPIVCSYKNTTYFPVLRSYLVDAGVGKWSADFQNIEWKAMKYDWAVFPPVPYLPKNIDENNMHSVSPFGEQNVHSKRWKHWMGTDELGHDVLAAMIHGTRIALLVGLVSMSIAAFIGIFLGALAGYYGDEQLKVTRVQIICNIIFPILALFYGFGTRSYILKDALTDSFFSFFIQLFISFVIIISIIYLGNKIAKLFNKLPLVKTKVNVPVDIIISRLIEVMLSVPTLFLIISIVAIAKPSLFLVMAVIGLTGWTGIARFIRAELLRVRSLEYIEAAHALGYSERRTIFKHAIPNALSPVLISIAFGIASAILTESTLSFLGIGVPAETLTWGALLSAARQSPTAWWLAVCPGLAIFITVTVYNLVGEGLTDALDPRLKK
jgi:peptide/nickel transport system permease protein